MSDCCHDHKFDPIPTHDYYSVQACFATTQLAERQAPFLAQENVNNFEERKYLIMRQEEIVADLQRLDEMQLAGAVQWYVDKGLERSGWNLAVSDARAFFSSGGKKAKRPNFQSVFDIARNSLQSRKLSENEVPPKGVGFSPNEFGRERVARKGLERLMWELDRYEPYALAVYAGRTPEVKSVVQPQRIPKDRMGNGISASPSPVTRTTLVRQERSQRILSYSMGWRQPWLKMDGR